MIHFTCPHCGQRATSDLTEQEVEYVDFDNGTSDGIFPMLPPDQERHIDQRLCCAKCYARADDRRVEPSPDGRSVQRVGPHRYDPAYHEQFRQETLPAQSRSALGFPPDRRMR